MAVHANLVLLSIILMWTKEGCGVTEFRVHSRNQFHDLLLVSPLTYTMCCSIQEGEACLQRVISRVPPLVSAPSGTMSRYVRLIWPVPMSWGEGAELAAVSTQGPRRLTPLGKVLRVHVMAVKSIRLHSVVATI